MHSYNSEVSSKTELQSQVAPGMQSFSYKKKNLATWFPGDSDGKEFVCNAGDMSSILGSGRSPGEGNGYPLQYSCLGNPTDRGTWQAMVHAVAKELDMTQHLNNKSSKMLLSTKTFFHPFLLNSRSSLQSMTILLAPLSSILVLFLL